MRRRSLEMGMRKTTGMMCAAILAASMLATGCSSKTAEPAKGETAGKDAGGEVALNFSWWGNDDRHQATQKAIDAFNAAHAGKIKVTGEPSGFGNLEETFATRYAGGTAADVMTVNYPWVLQYSPDGNGFYDLDQVKDIFDFS